jgi:uncharacterized membrane protein
MRAKASITVRRPRDEVHRRWRELEEHPGDAARLGPIEVLEDDPGRRIGWRTTPEAEAKAEGVVVFVDAPGDRGTELHLDLNYHTPAGPLGAAVKKLTGDDPLQMAKDDLRRFKELVEVGEIVRSESTPQGPSAEAYAHQRPAQPVESVNV